jgi:hypothetical protein
VTVGKPIGEKTGTQGNLYTLLLGDQVFQPDYYRHDHTTHYFRIHPVLDPETALKMAESAQAPVDPASVDKQALQDALAVAEGRIDDQTRWEALEVKVPEYAPWAPNGFMRLQRIVEEAREVNENKGKVYSQREVNSAASQLNFAINAMRPGNLPEMEDLRPLSAMMRRIGTVDDNASQDLKDAVAYAEMVMSYVKDGSGTQDMIDNAVARLKAFYEKEY